jgi:hypothetical protein
MMYNPLLKALIHQIGIFLVLACSSRYRRFAAVIRQKHSPDSNTEESVSIIPDMSSLPVVSPAASDDNLSEASSDTHCSPSTGTAFPLQAGHTFTLPTNDYMAVTSFEARDFEYLRFMSKFQQVLPYKMKSNKEKKMCAPFKHVYLHSVSFPAFIIYLLQFHKLHLKIVRVHLDLCALRLVAVRLPMPLRMQLCVHLAPCLFLMHAHAPSYSHKDSNTHTLFSLQATLLLRHVFIVHAAEVRSKAFYFVQSCFHCPHLIFVLEEL